MQETYNTLNRKRQGLLKKMSKVGSFMMATVSQRTTKCGRKECQCKVDEKKRHPTFRLSWTDSKGNGTCYVPKDIQKDVEQWIENYWKIKEYMTEMTTISRKMIRMYSKTLGRGKKNLKKLK